MASLWELISAVFLGMFAMGQVLNLSDSALDIGAFGTSTSSVLEIFFFFVLAAFVFITIRRYFS